MQDAFEWIFMAAGIGTAYGCWRYALVPALVAEFRQRLAEQAYRLRCTKDRVDEEHKSAIRKLEELIDGLSRNAQAIASPSFQFRLVSCKTGGRRHASVRGTYPADELQSVRTRIGTAIVQMSFRASLVTGPLFPIARLLTPDRAAIAEKIAERPGVDELEETVAETIRQIKPKLRLIA